MRAIIKSILTIAVAGFLSTTIFGSVIDDVEPDPDPTVPVINENVDK